MSERQYWIDRGFSKRCPDCYEKGRAIEIEKANVKAIEATKKLDLPELQGTKKQVVWATTLRMNHIKGWERYIENFNEKVEKFKERHSDLTDEEFQIFMGKTFENIELYKTNHELILENKISASYWIDTRNDDAEYKVLMFIKGK